MSDFKTPQVIRITCVNCRKEYDLTVEYQDWIDYRYNGKLVQLAFPYLTSGQRELFITQICDKCFNNMLKNS